MTKSLAAWLASKREARWRELIADLSPNAMRAMPFLWRLWAHPDHQLAPQGDWRVWVIVGGRGSGKTRAGAEWVRQMVEGSTPLDLGRARRVALVGGTIDEVRDVMVEGDSGLLAVTPPDRRPTYRRTLNRLDWPNGAQARLYSAANPESLRGPQFDLAWSDELAKWRKPRETWDMLQFCLRLGPDPRQIVTTTPRDVDVLAEIMEADGTVVTRAPTEANAANLAPGFLAALRARYGGTALGRQEIDGEMIRARRGALWSREMIEAARVDRHPALDRVVVAVDPTVTSGAGSDECGIVVAGVEMKGEPHDWRAYILADRSASRQSPSDWAGLCAEAYRDFAADRVVAEVNQGGDLVETLLRQVAPQLSYRAVRAARGKQARAEPVAALYEQGRVHHVGAFPELEDQMCRFDGRTRGRGSSPDRLDALVWALTDLVLAETSADPRVRGL